MKIQAMELIMIPLFILIGVGVIYNNISAVAGTSSVLTYNSQTGTWHYTNYSGCSGATCTVTSPSFLNPNSPYTLLMQGDIIGFVGSFTSKAESGNGGPSLGFYLNSKCTTISGGPATNSTSYLKCQDAFSFAPGASVFYGGLPYVNFTAPGGNLSIWSCVNCYSDVLRTQLIPISFYGIITNFSTIWGSGAACSLSNGTTYCLNNVSTEVQSNNQPNRMANAFGFLGFIFGIVLLVLSLGVGGGVQAIASGFNVQVSDQGARLAQVLGIGLTTWIPMFSEFGGWLTTSGLALGLGTILSLVLTIIYFYGLWWQTQSMV